MTQIAYTLAYGLVAAASPTVLLATLVVLSSGRGRLNGIMFLTAFVVGQSLAFALALFVGSAITLGDDLPGTVLGGLEVAVGLALVVGAGQRRFRGKSESPGPARSQAVFDRLSRVTPTVSFGVGMPLGVGVKRLLITFLAAATILADGLERREELALGALYVVAASVVVWCPVALYLVFGPRADDLIERTKAWITRHEKGLLLTTAFAFGLILILDGLARLL